MSVYWVRFYCMRHGEKDGDALTERGKAQVALAAKTHLTTIQFDAMYSSEMFRAAQTARIVNETLGLKLNCGVSEAFGHEWVDQVTMPHVSSYKTSLDQLYKEGDRDGYIPTIPFLLERVARANMVKTALEEQLYGLCCELILHYQRDCSVFVAGHSDVIELASQRNGTTRLGFADIIVYHFQIEPDRSQLWFADESRLICPKLD